MKRWPNAEDWFAGLLIGGGVGLVLSDTGLATSLAAGGIACGLWLVCAVLTDGRQGSSRDGGWGSGSDDGCGDGDGGD